MKLNDYLDYYTNVFIPVYADTVALLADKPEQLIIEQENSLSHLITYLKDTKDIDNLKKAKGHLQRATLDAYKMTWVELKKKLLIYTQIDKTNISIAFNLPSAEVLNLLTEFDKNIQEARLIEAKNIGKPNIDAINKYQKSVEIGFYLLSNVDNEKYISYTNFNIKSFLNNHIIGFILGITASLIASFILS